jgi:hypothetical protein
MTEKIKTGIIFLLAIALAFLIGRGYESRYMASVLSEHSELYALKVRTEQLVNQNPDEKTRRIFMQLGYDIAEKAK